ncbi:STAS domain-containing protein [Cytophaga hutchinsonii]|uniref:Anti-sigma factor antagonist n=1 Tax=Cytophaga hutchinsonii (strain ATCC 33406 / DSM 1761 / CIP 103989 / NBRC 15051 / NCIMB 9469 / D465) TaxID=269798 RepID=A0A6N4SMI7_CYTH3|nr:STAS domain-containing protein [Cytophaga hutchinsonii]ABG57486.1 anti-sigma F factor antagonist [Cytophaga hutchinsonii ATCC 33406]SFW98465.1 anti-sigma B factor antagonist [Cytophaga hutchinsonii ATCC 33406]
MRITSVKENEFYIVAIEGDLDASSSIQLDQAIEEAVANGENKIIVDCSQLEYISSAGLGVFMSYIQDFQSNNISLVLCHLSEKVRNVFQILGLDELLKIVDTKEEAKQESLT